MPFGVFGWPWEVLCSTCFATTFLHIRSRLPWRRPSVDAAGWGNCISSSWDHSTLGWASARISHTARARGCRRNTSARRFMDAYRGSACGGHCTVERCVATWRSVDLYPAGNSRCCPGTAGSWRLVGRCLPLWMETHPHSRSEALEVFPHDARILPTTIFRFR